MVVVAWVSKHEPKPAQISVLKEKLGDPLQLVKISQTFTSAEDIYNQIKASNAKYAVVVLPLSMIAILTQKKDVVWLWAEMAQVHSHSCPGAQECTQFKPKTDVVLETPTFNRHLRFKEFRKIIKVEMITERL